MTYSQINQISGQTVNATGNVLVAGGAGGLGSNVPALSIATAGAGLGAAAGSVAAILNTQIGVAGSALAGSLTWLAAAGPWFAVGAAVLAVCTKIFKGADPRQVPASQVEQAFEIVGVNLYPVAQAGMITGPELAAAESAALRLAIQYEESNVRPLGGTAYQKAEANLQQQIGVVQLQAAAGLPSVRTRTLDVEAAKAMFVQPGAAGWYAASVQAGFDLCVEYLQSLAAAGSAQVQGFGIQPVARPIVAQVDGVAPALPQIISRPVVGSSPPAGALPAPAPAVPGHMGPIRQLAASSVVADAGAAAGSGGPGAWLVGLAVAGWVVLKFLL